MSSQNQTRTTQSLSNRILPWAVAFALLALALSYAAKNMIVDLDLFHEMSLYRQMESEHQMPRTDAFAYTPTVTPVVHHEWATGAVMYWASVNAGLGSLGIVLVKYFLAFGICIGCYFFAARRGSTQAIIAMLAPLALLVGGGMAFTNVRAQLFTLFFFVVMYFLIEADRQGKRWWIAIWIPMFIAWGNIHGGVLSGLGILGVYGFVRLIEAYIETKSVPQTLYQVSHLIAVGVGSFLLLYVNPYGSDYVPYLLRAVTMPRPNIVEWWPIYKVKNPLFFYVSVIVAVYAIGSAVSRKGRLQVFEMLAVALTAYLAWKHYRHGSLYAVTWACFVPVMLHGSKVGNAIEGLWKKYTPQIAVLAVAIGLISMGYSINAKFWELRIPNQRAVASKSTTTFPVGACDYLKDNSFQGNVMVPFVAGAYVSWKLYPEVKVSIDSRYEVAYPMGALEDQTAFYTAADNWEEVLNKHDTHAILVPTNLALPIVDVLQARLVIESAHNTGIQPVVDSPSFPWKLVYQDNSYQILVKESLSKSLRTVDRRNEYITGVLP